MNTFWKLVAELGLPIVATIGMGAFLMIIIKYILGSVVSSITFIQNVITQLDNRVKTMNNDIIKIDQEVSQQLGLPVDTDRIARADGKKDARKD
jgi:predicted PurR-regulated permease PerM|tara:strand:+ start:739 stop:1020 length:282 start_codon:yes stop_codon:yes gene_type:complete